MKIPGKMFRSPEGDNGSGGGEKPNPAPNNPAGNASGANPSDDAPPADRKEAAAKVIKEVAKKKPKSNEVEPLSESTAHALLEELRVANGRAPEAPSAASNAPATKAGFRIRSGPMMPFTNAPEPEPESGEDEG